MTSTTRPPSAASPSRSAAASRSYASPGPTHGASRNQLLEAARLGGEVARADVAGRPADSAQAFAAWRRLRRRTGRRPRQLLRVAFDTGYGQAMRQAGPALGLPER